MFASVNGDSLESCVLLTVPQCAMVESQLSDVITLHTDVSGFLIGVSIVTLPGSCGSSSESEEELDEQLELFNTTVSLVAPLNAPGSVLPRLKPSLDH